MGFDWEGLLGEEGYEEVCAYGFDDYGYDTYGSSRCYEDDYFCEEDDCFCEENFDSDDNSDDSSEE